MPPGSHVAHYTKAIMRGLLEDGEFVLRNVSRYDDNRMRSRLNNAAGRAGVKITTKRVGDDLVATVIGQTKPEPEFDPFRKNIMNEYKQGYADGFKDASGSGAITDVRVWGTTSTPGRTGAQDVTGITLAFLVDGEQVYAEPTSAGRVSVNGDGLNGRRSVRMDTGIFEELITDQPFYDHEADLDRAYMVLDQDSSKLQAIAEAVWDAYGSRTPSTPRSVSEDEIASAMSRLVAISTVPPDSIVVYSRGSGISVGKVTGDNKVFDFQTKRSRSLPDHFKVVVL